MRLPRSHIQYAQNAEMYLAAFWANETIETFNALDTEQQAFLIALHRLNGQVQAVIAKEQHDRSRKG